MALLLLAGTAIATDRFVATTGSDIGDCSVSLSPCLTLQYAVNQSSPGDTINMAAGTYSVIGLVTINKTLSVKGAQSGVDARTRSGLETILSNTQGISVSANNVSLDGLTIQDSSNVAFTSFGIWLNPGVDGSVIINNIVQNNISGLGLSNLGTTQCLVQHNLFKSNNLSGGPSGTAIYTDQFVGGQVSNVLINENLFDSNNNGGIALASTDTANPDSNITISNNTIDNCGRGIYVFSTQSSSFTSNLIQNLVAPADGGSSTAIAIFGGVSSLVITDNNLGTGVKYGVRIANLISASNSSIQLQQNNISGFSVAALQVDEAPSASANYATCNWWGAPSGPFEATLNPGGTGDTISGSLVLTDFQPWLLGLSPGGICGPSPDLSISKSDGGVTGSPGGTLVYTLSYADSFTDAPGVVISETVPANTAFNAAASTAGWSCADGSPAGTSCDFSLGTVTAGTSGTVLFAVTINAPVAQGTTSITNTATIADDGTLGADGTPIDNTATITTALITAAQTVAVDPQGRFVVFAGAAKGCSKDLLFYLMLDSGGNPAGSPVQLISCGLLTGDALGIDLLQSDNQFWISFTGMNPADGKYLMKIDSIGNVLTAAKKVVSAATYGSVVGATALEPKGCCKLFLYAPDAGGSILLSTIDKTTLGLLKTKRTIATTPAPLSLGVTQRKQTPAFLAMAQPDKTFRAYELSKGLPDGATWNLSPRTDPSHELGAVSADGLAALSNVSSTPIDNLYLQMLGSNGRPINDPAIVAKGSISAVDISNPLSSSLRFVIYATEDGKLLLQKVDAVTGAKVGSPITLN